MGACHWKCCKNAENGSANATSSPSPDHRPSASGVQTNDDENDWYLPSRKYQAKHIDNLILQTLKVIGKIGIENPPEVLLKLHTIADQEDGWIKVINSMVSVIPIDNPLGPAVIVFLLDDCPLPNKDTVIRLCKMFDLSKESSSKGRRTPCQQCNMCIILGLLAEKLAGPSSVAMLTQGTLEYLVANLDEKNDPVVVLHSLIALEKFAQTSENKITIKKYFELDNRNPLLSLESMLNSSDQVRAQVGFCAQWCLDNLFPVQNRKYTYELMNLKHINAMLNVKDASEYLKISPDGLEARCDAYSFESVRCTFEVTSGVWYYETKIRSAGVMQIGWATKKSKFLNHEGYGIGDDEYSVAYDGCRQLIWHDAKSEPPPNEGIWRPGDILGCLLDVENRESIFYLNGRQVTTTSQMFTSLPPGERVGYFAAASFMSFQQCRFNFGNKSTFLFPPSREFQCFNEHTSLTDEERVVLPRHIQMEQLRNILIQEDSCNLCFDSTADVTLRPCGHSGFCKKCCVMLNECPMCRAKISAIEL
uniref:RING finger and SPRY domain-containing protein 1 n=1 Tax=Cacopsylla melanoneura TaxID=428564 RepID=A0A8D8PRS2_9HEMI